MLEARAATASIDLRHAIEQSCDVYFYTVANMVGVDKINKWATALGLGVKSGIDLPNEVQGLVPSTEWKREKMHEKWYAGETISVGIGQGAVSVTPVSMAVYMATLANGGTRVTPHLLEGGRRRQRVEAGAAAAAAVEGRHRSRQAAGDSRRPVDGRQRSGGTGGRARIAGRRRVGQDRHRAGHLERRAQAPPARPNKDLRDNGWFVFFAPRDNPQIAGVVFLEHGIHGGNAARVAHHILETFFAKQDGRPLPPAPTRLRLTYSDPFATCGSRSRRTD